MGTGSLGVERLLVLTEGTAQRMLFDIKEIRASAFSPAAPSAQRVIDHMKATLPQPTVMQAAAKLGSLPVMVTQLHAGADKISVDDYERTELPEICLYLGALTGELHRRGTTQTPRWSTAQQQQVFSLATELAAAHEAAFLQFCQATHDTVG